MSLHGEPTPAELVEAVREWIESDVLPAAEGGSRFHSRVAINVLAMVERELALGEQQESEHRARLATLGLGNNAEFARAIRAGDLDDRSEDVRRVLRADVDARLAVVNPNYLT